MKAYRDPHEEGFTQRGARYDKLRVVVEFIVRAPDIDTAEDIIADVLPEVVEQSKELGYEGKIIDYDMVEIELAEL